VLDAFRNCITEPKCKDCPWTECETIGHSTIEIPRDLALAVMRELVAHEPRVMTIDDMRDLKRGDFAIIEQKSGVIVPVIVEENIELNNDLILLQVVASMGKQRVNADYEYYGKTWRCWTSVPTEEQRESVKWD
jgi:hypothetical protein